MKHMKQVSSNTIVKALYAIYKAKGEDLDEKLRDEEERALAAEARHNEKLLHPEETEIEEYLRYQDERKYLKAKGFPDGFSIEPRPDEIDRAEEIDAVIRHYWNYLEWVKSFAVLPSPFELNPSEPWGEISINEAHEKHEFSSYILNDIENLATEYDYVNGEVLLGMASLIYGELTEKEAVVTASRLCELSLRDYTVNNLISATLGDEPDNPYAMVWEWPLRLAIFLIEAPAEDRERFLKEVLDR